MKIWPKNWSEFQHYKDRSPGWIKLHKYLLDDYDFHSLPVASRALAPCLWLLASESEKAEIPLDVNKIAFRVRMTADELIGSLVPLIEKGFFLISPDASELLAERYQLACLEKRREETETYKPEKEKKEKNEQKNTPLNIQFLIDEGVEDQTAKDWLTVRKEKSAPLTKTAWEALKKEAAIASITVDQAVEICAANNWRSFKAAWLKNTDSRFTAATKTNALTFTEADYKNGINEDGSF